YIGAHVAPVCLVPARKQALPGELDRAWYQRHLRGVYLDGDLAPASQLPGVPDQAEPCYVGGALDVEFPHYFGGPAARQQHCLERGVDHALFGFAEFDTGRDDSSSNGLAQNQRIARAGTAASGDSVGLDRASDCVTEHYLLVVDRVAPDQGHSILDKNVQAAPHYVAQDSEVDSLLWEAGD